MQVNKDIGMNLLQDIKNIKKDDENGSLDKERESLFNTFKNIFEP